jgi:4-hydroxy-tetrahydrodipicolinate synthase
MTSTTWSWDGALTGVVPPLISPLTDAGDVDGEATGALVEHVLGGGCSGLFVLGGCGEGAWRPASPRSSTISRSAPITRSPRTR